MSKKPGVLKLDESLAVSPTSGKKLPFERYSRCFGLDMGWTTLLEPEHTFSYKEIN